MKKLIALLAAGIMAMTGVSGATVVLSSTLASETFLAHDATYTSINLDSLKVVGLTGQATYTSAATPSPVTFQAGSQSSGSITIGNFAVLSAAAATDTLTVASNSNLTNASITLPGVVLREGIDWSVLGTTDLTAESIRSALDAISFITATRIGSVITCTAPVGTLYNSYGFTASVPSSLVVATALFTGGRNNAVVTVNGIALTQGTQWTASVSSAVTATSLTSAINTALGPVLTATANSPTNGVIALVSDLNGASSNFALASSVAAVTVSGPNMTGGVTANFTAGSATIAIASHGLTLGTPVLYTATATIAPLSAGTTYFAIPVTADSVKLATSKANALAGTAVTITEATPHLTASVGTLAALAITGTPGIKWQSSNDGSTWADLAVSSVTMTAYASPTRTESWNFGSVSFKFIRAVVTGPTTGGVALTLSIRGSDTALETFASDPKLFLNGPNNPGSPTINGTLTATAFLGNGSGLTGIASPAAVAAKLDKVGTSSLTITGAAGTITTQSSVTASAFFGNGSSLSGVGETNTFSSSKTFTGNVLAGGSVTASAFFGNGSNLSGVAAAAVPLSIEYVGTPSSPIPLTYALKATIPASPVSGPTNYPSSNNPTIGDMTLNDTGISSITFHNLYEAGYLSLTMAATHIGFPALTNLSGLLISDTSLTDLDIHLLTNCYNSGFSIISNLTSLAASSLTSVFGGFALNSNPSMVSASFPSLSNASGGFSVGSNASLTSLSMPVLANCPGVFSMTLNDALTSVSFPSLLNAGDPTGTFGGFTLGGSMGSVTTVSFPSMTTVRANFLVTSLSGATSVSFPALVSVSSPIGGSGDFTLTTLPLVTTMNFSSLATIARQFNPSSMAALTSLNFPSLQTTGNQFTPSTMAAVKYMHFPALTSVTGNFAPTTMAVSTSAFFPVLTTITGNFAPTTMATMASFNVNSLASVGGTFAPTTMAAITTWSLPALSTVTGNMSFVNMAALTTITLPVLRDEGGTITVNSGLGNVTNVTLGTIGTTKRLNGSITFSGQKLTQASVDQILCLVASLDGTNGTTSWAAGKALTLTGGTNSTPSAAGLVCKAVITGRGATVTNN